MTPESAAMSVSRLVYLFCLFFVASSADNSLRFEPHETPPIPTKGMLYPRDSETRTSQTLTGMWRFRVDDSQDRNHSFSEKWFARPLELSGPTIPMPVPSSYNDIGQDSKLRDFVGWAWYETNAFVSVLWKTQRVVLRFDSAHYYSMVWVNGKKVVEHEGGHLPFEADVSHVVKFGQANRITLALNNTLTPTTLPPGEVQFMTDHNKYPPGYFKQLLQMDFFNYAGIHRSVKLYATPKCHIDDVTITTRHVKTVGYVNYTLAAAGACKPSLTWIVEVLNSNGTIVVGGSGHSGALVVKSVNLWWPINMSKAPGYQYTLHAVLVMDGQPTDSYRQKFGVRSVSRNDKRLFVNEKPFYCQGFGKHEDADIRGKGLDYPLIGKDFNLIAWVGANCFRTSHYPYAEEIMDMADERGIMVIDESPGVGIVKPDNFGPISLRHHREVMFELVRRDKNRPSVFMWSVANEPASADKQAGPYFKSVIAYTRSLDPSRLVTFVVGGGQFSNDQAAQYVDVLCINRYFGWYGDTGSTEVIAQQLQYDLTNWYKKFKKPLIMTEYGADTIAGLHQDPPFVFTEEFQVEFIRQYHRVFDALRKDFLVGEMIWNFADFMTTQGITRVVGNRKGIFTRQRQPKMAAHVLRARYLSLKNGSNGHDEL